MPQGVPFLNKKCPFGYTIDATTGLCTLFNPWVVSGVCLGAGALGLGIGSAVARNRVQPNPREAVIAVSALGAGLAVGLIARALMAPSLPTASSAPIPDKVVESRLMQASLKHERPPPASVTTQLVKLETGATLPGVPPCEPGCVCIASTPDWCTTAQAFIRPRDVGFMVSYVVQTSAPPKYDFVANVAQWISFFKYQPDPLGDVWCPPLQTYSRGMGDCEDLSLLTTSVLVAGGVDTSLTVGTVQDPRGDFGHAWVEGTDALGWFLIEATNGKLYRGQRPAIYEPVLRVRGGRCAWGYS